MNTVPIVQLAHLYCSEKKIHPVPVYSAKKFAEVIGDKPAELITQTDLQAFAAQCPAAIGTIRGKIKDVITLCRYAGNMALKQCVKKPAPKPNPTPISSIEAVWPWLAPWSQQWMVLAYWTGLRLSDVITLQCEGIPESADRIRKKANKTGKFHTWPLPRWMRKWTKPVKLLPYSRASHHAKVIVWGELDRVCQIAKVPRIFPQEIRQRSVNEWANANATAGAIVQGMALGVMQHYIAPMEILESAAHRMKLPAVFEASSQGNEEETLLANFRRLDVEAKGLVLMTAQRMA